MKKYVFGLVVLVFAVLSGGCADGRQNEGEQKTEAVMEVTQENAAGNAPGIFNIQEKTAEGDLLPELEYDKARQKIGLTGDYIQEELHRQTDKYGLAYLENGQKQLYIEIYAILTHRASDILISTLEVEEIEPVFQCVLNDHPEIFYVAGYTFTKYTSGDEIKRITFSGSYTYTAEEIKDRQERMERYVAQCLSGISQDAGEYEKVKYVYEYLIYHTDYKLEAGDNQNICSVFLSRESVCQGYAKATQLLLNRLGIMATLVLGSVESGEGHAWNLVSVDGAYYYVDTTWGDAYYVLGEDEYEYPEEKLPKINYDYLLVTTDQLCKTHTIDNVVPMPRCVATQANYYVMEGAYFTSLDRDGIGKLFENAYAQGKDFVTMKLSSPQVYQEVEEALLENQEVFNYLKSEDGVVAYTNSEKQLSLSFWL